MQPPSLIASPAPSKQQQRSPHPPHSVLLGLLAAGAGAALLGAAGAAGVAARRPPPRVHRNLCLVVRPQLLVELPRVRHPAPRPLIHEGVADALLGAGQALRWRGEGGAEGGMVVSGRW